MDMLKSLGTPMKVFKPYKISAPAPSEQKTTEPEGAILEGPSAAGLNMMIPPAALLPSPPPQQLYLYQMLQGPPQRKRSLPSNDPQSPFPIMPVTNLVPAPKTKPRTVHEYYDQHSFQWREFNPEDTVIGDETDPFIVYFRYANKSIGARRTPWLLPKHARLVKIMQDCLPDFDWRSGEDMLVCPFMIA